MSRFSAVAKQFPSLSKSCAFVFDSPAPQAHNGGMNENNDADKSGEQPEGGNRPGQPLTRSEKIISTGLIAVAAVLWGVYGPGLMKDSWVEKWMDTSMGVAVLFIVCIAVSCTILHACKEEERAKDGKGKGIAAGNAAEGGRASRGEPNDKGSSPRLWTKWHPAAIPWLITLPLLLTTDFQWQALMSGLWVLVAFLIVLWDYFAKTEPKCHPTKPDLLGRGLMYSRFGDKIRLLVGEQDRGLSIVVTGEWGSGKSHFINATVASLEQTYKARKKLYRENLPGQAYKGKFVAVNVDLWQASTVEAMWQDVARALLCILKEYDADMNSMLQQIMGWLLSLLPFHITTEAKDIMNLVATGTDPYAITNKLYKRFERSSKRYILVMDNIDRCDEKIQRNVFSLIERLNQVPHLVVICGIANGDIATAISDGSPSIRSALLKVFDLQVPMPRLAKREASDYLYDVLSNIKIDCPNFKTWCSYQDFSCATPRHIERIASRLSLFDNMYLMRKMEEESIFEYESDKNEPNNTIFCFEAMRTVYPEILFPYADPSSFESEDKSYTKWKEYIYSTYCDENDRNLEKGPGCILPKMARHLCDENNGWIDSIANQEHLRISALTDKECEHVLDNYKEGATPISTLENAYGGAYHPKNVKNLIRCLCWYCLSHPEHNASLSFMEALCTTSLDINLLPRYAVTNLIVVVQSEYVERSRWQNCLKSIIRIYPVEWLAEEVSKIVDYIGKEKERIEIRYELSARLTKLAKDILDRYGSEGENSDKLNKVADQLLREYAKKACAFILDSPSLNDYGLYKHLMIGKSVTQEIYEDSLKKGVQEFLHSDASMKYRQKVGEHMTKLLRSIIIRSHDSDTLELTDMPFAVFSFAVIWNNLIRGLLGQRKLSMDELATVEERLAAVYAREARDGAMSKEEKDAKGSEQFWRNRETAMRILRTTLERLKKKANE